MENLDFRKWATVGIVLTGIATFVEVVALEKTYYKIGAAILAVGVIIYALVVRKRSNPLPLMPEFIDNKIMVRPIITPAEFEELDKLYHHCFGSSSVPTEVLRSWWNANPKGLIGLLRCGEIVGGVSIWSIDDLTYEKIINGFIKER